MKKPTQSSNREDFQQLTPDLDGTLDNSAQLFEDFQSLSKVVADNSLKINQIDSIGVLREQLQTERAKITKMSSLMSEMNNENRKLESRLKQAHKQIKVLKLDLDNLKIEKMALEKMKNSFNFKLSNLEVNNFQERVQELEKELAKSRQSNDKKSKYCKMVQKEIIPLAKKLRSVKPSWNPNKQTESIFFKDVIKQTNHLFSEFREMAQLNGSSQYGLNRQNSDSSLRKGKKNPLFRKAMSLLTLCLSQIDEINNTFDDMSIDQYGNPQLQMDRIFPKFLEFFEKIETLRTSSDAKELSNAFYL